jgi:hypothetical protein
LSSRLQQLQVGYDQLQDRILLTLFTTDFSEYQFWITRRATKALWGILTKLLEKEHKDQLQRLHEEERIAEQISREKEQRQASAERFGTKLTRRPLGDEPLLLYKIMGKALERGQFALRFEDSQGRFLEVGGESAILLALCELIKKSSLQAEWQLQLENA